MQDRKIQNFLRDYFKIFNEGLLGVLGNDNYDVETEIGSQLVPTMYKNLGDGLMIVWEITPGLDNLLREYAATAVRCYITEAMEEAFYSRFKSLSPVEIDAYSREVTKLRIGFGVAKGHAWRLDLETTSIMQDQSLISQAGLPLWLGRAA